MPKGKVTKYYPNEGYGLILDENGEELFFYSKDLQEQCQDEIKVGKEIEFDPSRWNHYHAVHLCQEHKDLEAKIKSHQ